jgi:SET domain
MSFTLEDETTPVVNHDIPCPGVTDDYKIVVDSRGGYKVIANRRIKKNETIMKNSLEFMFSDVREGDNMWLAAGTAHHHHHHHHKTSSSKLIKDKGEHVPERIPVTRDMLLRTHGVPYVIKKSPEEVVLRTYLEVPTMFVNHSCEPTIQSLHNEDDTATRDIEVGEELTCDYAICDYEDVAEITECLCDAPSCRGKALGFGSLSAEDKQKLLPSSSPPVVAEYLAQIGKGPPVREFEDIIPRPLLADTVGGDAANKVMRLMWPGPSWSVANIVIKKDENSHGYALFSSKNVRKGKRFYDFWRQRWPQGETTLIDMVLAPPDERVYEGDVQEGTCVRLDASKCASYRNAKGQMMFSGWEMLNTHSCDPNVVYRINDKYEDENWQSVFAAKDIKKGDRITMDWNCFAWDRGDCADMAVCHCGASNCVGTKQGFKYLAPEAQTERTTMTFLRKPSPLPDNNRPVAEQALGKALSPYVRAMWQNVDLPQDSGEVTDECTSCSDSSVSDNNKEE